MYNAAQIAGSNPRRLIRDFDEFVDLLHNNIDREELTRPHGEDVSERTVEFTTEWQMASTAEEGSSR